jgi:alpha-L-rhamnosidase
MHSGFAAYFFESLGGIKSSESNPGFKVFTVNPEFPSKITSTMVSVPTPYGDIKNDWETKEGVLSMTLKVPFNTKAKLILSKTEFESVQINGVSFNSFQNENDIEIIEESNIVLGSGTYEVTYKKS